MLIRGLHARGFQTDPGALLWVHCFVFTVLACGWTLCHAIWLAPRQASVFLPAVGKHAMFVVAPAGRDETLAELGTTQIWFGPEFFDAVGISACRSPSTRPDRIPLAKLRLQQYAVLDVAVCAHVIRIAERRHDYTIDKSSIN